MIGAILIVIGLYSVLWGKHREQIERKVDDIPLPVKGAQVAGNAESVIDATDQFTNEVKSGQRGEANNNRSSVVISMPTRETPRV